MDYLADRTKLIDASGIRKVFALAAELKDPVNFSIGQPDFDVPPAVKKAAIKAIENGHNHYSQTVGTQNLLQKIRDKVAADYGWADPSLLVTSGVSGGLLLAFMAAVNPGDEVIVPDPYFVMYKHLVRMLGGTCVFADSYPDFKLPVETIEALVTKKTKMLILNSPTNPTGAVYTEQEIKAIADIARRHDLLVISDEIYEDFCYDGCCASMGNHYDGTLVLKGYSKSYAMTGWRMGYAVGTEKLKPLIDKMIQIQQYTFVCAPTPFQMAAVEAMDLDISDYISTYRRKRNRVYEGIKNAFEAVKPGGAFYMFIKTPDRYSGATEFVKKAIENNLLIIPGNVFSEKDTHFRIAYTTTDDKLDRGIDILCRLAK
ncbi:MAG: aminotransferase class I/II-fold pyridoxal phosphate-dependent enzyme [Planctomycetales bacterium]|nr:aminotransferase class I/II-fold pyridoxal phosphate-dependent enzyme [Planctomycetales bacterium]